MSNKISYVEQQKQRYEQFGIYYDSKELDSLCAATESQFDMVMSFGDQGKITDNGVEFPMNLSVSPKVLEYAPFKQFHNRFDNFSLGAALSAIEPNFVMSIRQFSSVSYYSSRPSVPEEFEVTCTSYADDGTMISRASAKLDLDSNVNLTSFLNLPSEVLLDLVSNRKKLRITFEAKRTTSNDIRKNWVRYVRGGKGVEDSVRELISADVEATGSYFNFKGSIRRGIYRLYRLNIIFIMEFLFGIKLEKTKRMADITEHLKAAPMSDFGIKDVDKLEALSRLLGNSRYKGLSIIVQDLKKLGLVPVKKMDRWKEVKQHAPEWCGVSAGNDSGGTLAQSVQDSKAGTLANLLK